MLLTKRLARGRIYYGWYIVATAFIAQCMSSGLQVYTFGIFLQPMGQDMGWSRGELSAVQSVSTLVNGLLAVFIGPFIDKRGGRQLMVVGAVITGLGMAAVSLVGELWQFYLVRGVVVTIGMVFIGNLVVNVAVSNWFIKQRGRAIAIGTMGISAAGIVVPPLTQSFIADHGWRGTWVILGLLVVLFIAPTGGLLMCRRPEDIGLLPDGERVAAPTAGQPAATRQPAARVEYRWERRQAMRTSALWLIIIAFSMSSMSLGAIMFHIFPFLTDKGFSPALAATAMSVIGLTGMACKPIWGLIIEKVPCKYCAAFVFACCALGVALILAANSITTIFASIFLFSAAITGTMIAQEIVWAEYFGRLTLGSIRSVGIPITIVTSAVGPVFAGVVYDNTHSYQFAFTVFAAAYVVACVFILLSRRPVPPTEVGRDETTKTRRH